MAKNLKEYEQGYFRPKGWNAFILFLVKCGFGRGSFKFFLATCWRNKNQDLPVDLNYHDLKLRLFPNNNSIESKILFSSKVREKVELKYMKSYLKNGGIFVDIGANIGYYSLMAAKFGAKKVVAAEPNPTIYSRFLKLIELNNFKKIIHAYKTGIGKNKDTLELTICPHDMGSSSVCNSKIVGHKVNIPIAPLSDLMDKENIDKIDVLKIDIEGMEDKALFPYLQNIQKENFPKMIIIEDNQDIWEKNILEWMLSNGYQIKDKTRGNYILVLT